MLDRLGVLNPSSELGAHEFAVHSLPSKWCVKYGFTIIIIRNYHQCQEIQATDPSKTSSCLVLLCSYVRSFGIRLVLYKNLAALDAIPSNFLEQRSEKELFQRYLSLDLLRTVDIEMVSSIITPGLSSAALSDSNLNNTYGAFFIGLLLSAMWVSSHTLKY